jgi:hypothetical protein
MNGVDNTYPKAIVGESPIAAAAVVVVHYIATTFNPT